MIRDVLVLIANVFIIEPFQAEMSERLASAKAPQAIVQQVMDCAASAPSLLAETFSEDLLGSALIVIKVAIGMTSTEAVLAAKAPACAAALAQARPFLEAEGA
ncbi:MAG: hypothetical protein ACKOBM_16190 [Gammaproteobacteria bacterium]